MCTLKVYTGVGDGSTVQQTLQGLWAPQLHVQQAVTLQASMGRIRQAGLSYMTEQPDHGICWTPELNVQQAIVRKAAQQGYTQVSAYL
jgi:hypothetical protein